MHYYHYIHKWLAEKIGINLTKNVIEKVLHPNSNCTLLNNKLYKNVIIGLDIVATTSSNTDKSLVFLLARFFNHIKH